MHPHLQAVLSFCFAKVIKIIRVPNVSPGCAIIRPFSNFYRSVGKYVLPEGTLFSNNMFNEV
jgi:hypothetical protein